MAVLDLQEPQNVGVGDLEGLWETRAAALRSLETDLRREHGLLVEALTCHRLCIEQLEMIDSAFARVVCMVSVKGRNLALGCLSLALDGLGQEGGALFRPLIEATELLTYLRMSPEALEQAMEDRLPSAGKRAKRVSGKFKEIRDYLNHHSAHIAVNWDSSRHLVDLGRGRFKVEQRHDPKTLRLNLSSLFAVEMMCAIETASCLVHHTGTGPEVLLRRIDQAKVEGAGVFGGPRHRPPAGIDVV